MEQWHGADSRNTAQWHQQMQEWLAEEQEHESKGKGKAVMQVRQQQQPQWQQQAQWRQPEWHAERRQALLLRAPVWMQQQQAQLQQQQEQLCWIY